MKYYKTDADGLVRDGSTGAILNTNNTEYLAYKQRRAAQHENDMLKAEVNGLKQDMQEIKSLLLRMLRE